MFKSGVTFNRGESSDGPDPADIDEEIPRHAYDALPIASSPVTYNRANEMGLIDKYFPSVQKGLIKKTTYWAWWRFLENHPPMAVHFPSAKQKLEELTAFRQQGLSLENLNEALEFIKLVQQSLEENPGSPVAKEEFINYLNDPENAALKAWLTNCLHHQYGRDTMGLVINPWNVRSEIGKERSQDEFGKFRIAESIELIKNALFYDGISLDVNETTKKVESYFTDPEDPEAKPVLLYSGEEGKDGFTFSPPDPNVPAKYRDKATIAQAMAVIEHSQHSNSNKATIGPGSPAEIIRMAAILVCQGKMEVDFSQVDGLVIDALEKSSFSKKEDLLNAWEEVKNLSKDNDRRFKPMHDADPAFIASNEAKRVASMAFVTGLLSDIGMPPPEPTITPRRRSSSSSSA